ncbi:MAG: sigma-54 dependent transcriptional regulator [Kiritimatiellaeota bacterium]|nr:sigma-54 dependent transcriptional regulator [Kiritimatiellota bacterium]
MSRILIVDDEPIYLSILGNALKPQNHEITTARSGEAALALLKQQTFDLMISDIRMEPMDGMQLLRQARQDYPHMDVIMLTAHGTVETAVEAMKMGAFDYVRKPFKVDELLITVQRALQYQHLVSENQTLKKELAGRYQFENIVAESPGMRNVCEMVKRVAPTDATVLILGESGTGKELVAKAIHAHSPRKAQNFLPINCAALPEPLLESEMFGHMKGAFTGATANVEGLFEAANNGTIFLDEISTMPLNIQAKLLRVLQDKEVRRIGSTTNVPINVRVLAATNDRLEQLIEQGKFREDLFYRFSVITIQIPPLRERPEDILPLVQHILKREVGPNKPLPTLEPDAAHMLETYPWPGNVRELENAIRHALIFAGGNQITKAVLPARILNASFAGLAVAAPTVAPEDLNGIDFKTFCQKKEREYLNQFIAAMGGDKEKAAHALKISLATLYRIIARKD